MLTHTNSPLELRLLLHAPTGRDARLLSSVLERANLPAVVCLSIDDLCSEIACGVGAVLVAEEALGAPSIEVLSTTLEKQETWSDVPIIVFTVGGEPTAAARTRLRRLEPLGDISLLERPLRSDTIVHAAKAALRARNKQYDLRRRDAELQLVNDNVPVLISYIDEHRVHRRVNRTYSEWFGLEAREIVGRSVAEIFGEPHYSMAGPFIGRALLGERVSFEAMLKLASGHLREVNVSYAPEMRTDGHVGGFVALVQDITERKRREKELERANDELKRANRELQDFGYAASHDLQEPLRNIAAYSQLLTRRYTNKLDEEGQHLIAVINSGVHRMSALIAGLLEYSHASQIELDASPGISLTEALEGALADLQLAIAESKARVVHDGLPHVSGDKQLLTQLFQNLIGNAIKYRRSEPLQVAIRCREHGEDWLLSIEDNGQGFAPEYAGRIFGLFKRLHGKQFPGTGIGLAICRRVVERHGGRIWAEGRPGQGATFYFTLPRVSG